MHNFTQVKTTGDGVGQYVFEETAHADFLNSCSTRKPSSPPIKIGTYSNDIHTNIFVLLQLQRFTRFLILLDRRFAFTNIREGWVFFLVEYPHRRIIGIFSKRASEYKDHPTHATHVAETKIVVSKLALDNHTSSPWQITTIVPGVYVVQKMTSTSWFFRSIWSHSCQFTCAHLLPRFDWQSPQIRSNCGTSICWREPFDAFNKQKYNQGVKTVHQVGWSPKWTPSTCPSWNQSFDHTQPTFTFRIATGVTEPCMSFLLSFL
jgi:hypothetical protein